jgi:WD40 repeat protein
MFLPLNDVPNYLPSMPDVAFSPIESTLLATTGDYLQLWDVAVPEKRTQVISSVRFIAFSLDGHLLAGVDGASLYLYDVETLVEIDHIDVGAARIGAMLFSDDSQLFAYERTTYDGFRGSSVRIWETNTLSEFALITSTTPIGDYRTPFFQYHIQQWSNQPEFGPPIVWTSVNLTAIPAACQSRDHILDWISATSPANTPIQTFQGHEFPISKICLSSDGHYVITSDSIPYGQTYPSDARCSMRAWNVVTGQQVRLLEYIPSSMSVYSLAFSPDGRFFAAVEDMSITIWDTSTWHIVATIQENGYRQLLFMVGGDMFVARTYWGDISFWVSETGKRLRVLEDRRVSDMLLSPDGSLLALARENDTVELWGVPIQ